MRKSHHTKQEILKLLKWSSGEPPRDRPFLGRWFSQETQKWVTHIVYWKDGEWWSNDSSYPWRYPEGGWREVEEGDEYDEEWYEGR